MKSWSEMVPQEHISTEGHSVVGYTLYFYTYNTWSGRCVYMADLYVMPDFRGKGIGKALLASVAKVCSEQQCARLQFSVLKWNKFSLDFYLSKGAQDLIDAECWRFICFDGEALENLTLEAP
ncbi:thialysine N-epsilon-acetyltransferase-like isoform X2 [Hoplias malabaricus]|uniref:thialysine N-epsilon-acetyltransferase-like isoform X2 n=1 Tax=Hoplias malabaricus TaxID=27720 RepID=UPI003462CC34